MSSHNIAHLDYQLFPSVIKDKPESEEHKQKALIGLAHITGLGHLLRCVEIDWEGDPDAVAQRIDDANAGIRAAADLIVMIGDLAYHAVDLLDDLHQAMIAYLQEGARSKAEDPQREASGASQRRQR